MYYSKPYLTEKALPLYYSKLQPLIAEMRRWCLVRRLLSCVQLCKENAIQSSIEYSAEA